MRGLRCGDPAERRAVRSGVPVAVRGVVHEPVEGERVAGPQKLLRDALPCRGRGVARLRHDPPQLGEEHVGFRRR